MDRVENILWQVSYLKSNNWLKARKLLMESIEIFPKDINLKKALADLYLSKHLFKKAVHVYQQILMQDPDQVMVRFHVGNCFLSLKEFKLALNYYDQIKEVFPELLYNKSFALSKVNRIDEAIIVLENLLSVQTNVRSELPYIFLAELYYTRREFDKTIANLKKAENAFGKKGSIFYLRGLTYFNLENWLKAYLAFENAAKLRVSTPHFLKNHGLACEKIGKTAQAIDLMLKSIKKAPLDPGGYIELIKIYLAHSRVMEAYSIAQHAKKNIPFSITLSMLYDQILREVENDFNLKKD